MAAVTAFTEGPDGQPTMRPLDPANLDTTVQPCQDFFRYANGGWLDRNPVPAAYSAWGSFNELQDRNYEFLKAILENAASKTNAPKGSTVQLVGDLFASGMDSLRAEADGFMPIAEELSRIDAINDSDGLQKIIAHMHRMGFEPLFLFSSVQDFKNSEMVIADIDQSGLTLPDRDYYTKEDDRSEKIREEYVSYITKMFQMLGDDSATAASEARTVLAFESRLASASMTRVDRRDPEKVYHKMTIDELGMLTPEFSWKNYVKNVERSDIKDVNLEQPEYIKEVDR
ncbi:MAG TPA: M13 family metallopeptidase N-terminal domain-containing protein, partial [Bacteroidota bacterium]